jgi:hypothetical protein
MAAAVMTHHCSAEVQLCEASQRRQGFDIRVTDAGAPAQVQPMQLMHLCSEHQHMAS